MSNKSCCLGIIETKGLSPALEAADTMLKSGQIELAGLYFVGGGQVAVVITGTIGPVQAAVEDGVAASKRKGEVLNRNVIPRCHDNLMKLLEALRPELLSANEHPT